MVGDGGRKADALAASRSRGSGDRDSGDAAGAGDGAFGSEMVSAWKNLLSFEGLPNAEKAGGEASCFLGVLSCFPSAWKKTGARFCGGSCSCGAGRASLAWKNSEDVPFAELASDVPGLYMFDSGNLGVDAGCELCKGRLRWRTVF